VKKLNGGRESLSCCPGEGQIHAAKTRREIDVQEALPRLPPSNADNLAIFLLKQSNFHFGFSGINTTLATEKPAPVLAA
jgi:hypothetical protein